MNDFSNIAEYSAQKKRSKAFNICKTAVPISFGALSVITANFIVGTYGFTLGFLAFVVLIASSMSFSAIYFRRVDYDYRIVGNELYFSIVYNRKSRRELGYTDISKLERIAPYRGKFKEEADKTGYDKICDYSSSPDDGDVYYAVENDEENSIKTIYLFNASKKMLKLLKLYNRRTVTGE